MVKPATFTKVLILCIVTFFSSFFIATEISIENAREACTADQQYLKEMEGFLRDTAKNPRGKLGKTLSARADRLKANRVDCEEAHPHLIKLIE